MPDKANGKGARIVRALDRGADLLSQAAAFLATIAMLASLALVVFGIAARYLLKTPQSWSDELVGYLLVGIVMFAATDALRKGEHIAIDILTGRLKPAGRRLVALLGLATVALFALLMIDKGWEMVAFSRMVDMHSNQDLGAPLWVVQLMIPVGGILLLISAVTLFLRELIGDPVFEDSHLQNGPVQRGLD
ncbi:MAG: TRAP transporter small permease [Rhodospirillales bacterium]